MPNVLRSQTVGNCLAGPIRTRRHDKSDLPAIGIGSYKSVRLAWCRISFVKAYTTWLDVSIFALKAQKIFTSSDSEANIYDPRFAAAQEEVIVIGASRPEGVRIIPFPHILQQPDITIERNGLGITRYPQRYAVDACHAGRGAIELIFRHSINAALQLAKIQK
ncbi:MAG: hypothetical protein IPK89_10640 [Sphingomonadales bacterium]|nr:hypothetical protein [Sphingomonadales bacterium]